MATAINWPPLVLAAAALKFEAPVTAFLWMPKVDFPCLIGRVYMDLRGRFEDGRLIRTSEIVSLTKESGYSVAGTFSGSRYVLIHDGDDPFGSEHSGHSGHSGHSQHDTHGNVH